MKITVFTIAETNLKKRYSVLELQEEKIDLLFYSEFVKICTGRGRPAKIWHEGFLFDIIDSAQLYLKYHHVFSHKWIEKQEFQKVVDNEHLFRSCTYGVA